MLVVRQPSELDWEISASYARPFNLLGSAVETRTRLASLNSDTQRETEGPPLSTLDVVGGDDGLLHRQRSWAVVNIAKRQLDELKGLRAEGPSESRCLDLLRLLHCRI